MSTEYSSHPHYRGGHFGHGPYIVDPRTQPFSYNGMEPYAPRFTPYAPQPQVRIPYAPQNTVRGHWVLGDSIGVGVGGDGAKTAKGATPIRHIISQLQQIPPGSRAVIFSGTNDVANWALAVRNGEATDRQKALKLMQDVRDVLAAAREQNITISLWAGPAIKEGARSAQWFAHNQRVPYADGLMRRVIEGHDVRYMSLVDGRAPYERPVADGLHGTARGYGQLRQHVAMALSQPTPYAANYHSRTTAQPAYAPYGIRPA